MVKEYAVYKKDELLFIGTIEECCKFFNVKKNTVVFWACPANIKQSETGVRPGQKPRKKERSGRKIAIKLWEIEEDE